MGMKRAFVRAAFGAVALAAVTGCSRNITDSKVERIAIERVARLQSSGSEGVLIIDARRPEQFGQGHIPGAKNMRLPDIGEGDKDKDPRLERYRTIVVYGEDPGSASAMAVAKRLMTIGYKDVKLFEAGYSAWQLRGLPTSRAE